MYMKCTPWDAHLFSDYFGKRTESVPNYLPYHQLMPFTFRIICLFANLP